MSNQCGVSRTGRVRSDEQVLLAGWASWVLGSTGCHVDGVRGAKLGVDVHDIGGLGWEIPGLGESGGMLG